MSCPNQVAGQLAVLLSCVFLSRCTGVLVWYACRETHSLRLAKLRGVTFVNQYVVIKYLGKGANGRVFLCLDMADSRLYAVKVGHPMQTPYLNTK